MAFYILFFFLELSLSHFLEEDKKKKKIHYILYQEDLT
jgi:hypothetical protein